MPAEYTDHRLRRIAFVTRRFGDLQGLRTVAFGAALIVGVMLYDLVGTDGAGSLMALPVVASLIGNGARGSLDRYYRHTFGNTSRSVGLPGTHFAVLPGLVISGLTLDGILTAGGDVKIGIGGGVLFGYSLWVVIRDWPHRTHYVAGAVAGISAVTAALVSPARTTAKAFAVDPSTAAYFTMACGVIGLALVVMGLLDQHLLADAMRQQPSTRQSDRLPPDRLATTRMVVAGTMLATLLIHFATLNLAAHESAVMAVFFLALLGVTILAAASDLLYGVRTFNQTARQREAALVARVTDASRRSVVQARMRAIPRPDVIGDLVLPIAMACGALLDVQVRNSGWPSLLALAILSSHLRIATRDWPERKHYLLSAAAALIAAVQHALIASISRLDWAISFLMLMSISMLVVGFFDRRLEARADRCTDERHAHTV